MKLAGRIYNRFIIEPLLQRFFVRRALKNWPLLKRVQLVGAQREQDLTVRNGDERWADLPVRHLSEQAFQHCILQHELDALKKTGGTLHLPVGIRELRNILLVPSNVRVVGIPNKTELIFKGVNYGFVMRGTAGRPVRGSRIENLVIRHTERPPTFTASIFLSHVRDVCLRNVEIVDPEGIGFLLSDDTRRVTLEHCRVYRAGIEGFLFLRSVSEIVMKSCLAQGCGQSGMLLADWRLPAGMDELSFNEQAQHAATVVGFEPDDPGPVRILLNGCIFRGNRKMGICTDGAGLLKICDCKIADNQCEGITLDNGAWCCQVLHCHILGNGRRALQRDDELQEDFVNEWGLMEDGSSHVKLPGISSDNAVYCRIENNLIENNYGDGVKFVRSGYGCTVAGNMILSNNRGYSKNHPHYGVHLDSHPQQRPGQITFPATQIQVYNNDIIGRHYAGINLAAGCLDNRIYNNRIEGYDRMPIENMSLAPNRIES